MCTCLYINMYIMYLPLSRFSFALFPVSLCVPTPLERGSGVSASLD